MSPPSLFQTTIAKMSVKRNRKYFIVGYRFLRNKESVEVEKYSIFCDKSRYMVATESQVKSWVHFTFGVG